MSENSAARKKDVLLEHISRDIKGVCSVSKSPC